MWALRTIFVVLASARAALAAPPIDVAILPIEAAGLESDGERIQEALEAALAESTTHRSRGPSPMRLDEARLTFSCFDESEVCMAQVGDVLEASQLLWGTLEAQGDARVLKLQLVDVQAAKFVRRERFESRGGSAIDELVASARAFVRGPEAPAQPRLEVKSDPPGAAVFVDGQMRGATPVTLDLGRGSYTVELRLPGHLPVARRVSLTDETRAISETLVASGSPAPAAPPEAQAGGHGFWLGIGAGGVAVASAGIATALGLRTLQLRDDAEGAETESAHARAVSEGEDKRLLSNVAWGVAAAAAATSAYFLFFYEDAPPRAAVQVGPAGLGVGGRF